MANKPKTNMRVGDHEYYRIKKTVGYKYINGKKVQIQKSFTGHNQTEAKRKYEEWLKSQDDHVATETFGELADYYNDNILKNSQSLSGGTIILYRRAYQLYVRPCKELMSTPISSVDIKTLQDVIFDLGTDIKNRPINTLKWMRSFYKWASASGYCSDISGALVRPRFDSSPRNDIEVWDDKSIQILLDQMEKEHHRLRFFVIFALNTGLRVGEILSLEYSDIQDGHVVVNKQLQRGEVIKPKSKASYRTVPLNDTVMRELEIYHEWHKNEMKELGYQTDVIFTTKTGNYISHSSLRHSLVRVYKRIKNTPRGSDFVPHRIHSFRSTFATKLAKNGVRLEILMRLLGHSSIDITAQFYTGVDDHDKLDAVNLI